ncbi:MAG TPA: cytochrome-c oxidase, cbb3-type subunit III [Usitatibacter sp.]|jgi:cytochrome c oxidase cbb3-type subunit 3|nr:cytochrome-c oxidase, cbb3-type subunit III [Usitatibacter sp.]
MSDFTSGFWSLFVAGVTLLSIVACGLLLMSLSKRRTGTEADTTGHAWDGDLQELNNPLPRWWVWLFWITIFFAFGYLALYPGLGRFPGVLKWTSRGQYQAEVAQADQQYGPIYQKFASIDIATLSRSPEAHAVGEKLFLNYCAQCHASDARGGKGFPNLTDGDWLYGGDPETIQKTILDGRNGTMPAWGAILGEGGVKETANYVRSLSGLPHDAGLAEKGKAKFATFCIACHGAEGKGNMALGAPNLTDKVWLYGSSEATIIETIARGRSNTMPAHREFLGEPRVHVLAAYVYGLSNPARVARAQEGQ